MDDDSTTHGMLPGSHESLAGPQCRCGGDWSRWLDMCAHQVSVVPVVAFPGDELDATCVYCAHLVGHHDTAEGCSACGCTRVVFWDDDRGDE